MASVLELILRSRKEGDAAKKTEDELKRLEKASGSAAAAAKKLNLGMLAVEGAVITAGMSFLKSIPAILDQGVEIERAETALIAYSGSAEEAARTIDLMKDAAGGAMSRMDAMRNATRLLSMGLASTADEAAKMTEVAITLGSTMGKGPQAALEDFSLMLANQSIPRLDTFGIAGAKVREIMQDLADKGIAPTDRQTRFLIATMEVAEEKMALLEEAGYQATSSVDRLKAVVEDTKTTVISWLADGLMPWIDGLLALRDAHFEHEEAIIRSTGSYQEYITEYERIHSGLPVYARAIGALTEEEWAAARAMDGMTAAAERYAIQAGITIGASEDMAAANTAVALSLGDITQAELAREAMSALNTVMKEQGELTPGLEMQYRDLAANIAGMDDDAIDAQLDLFRLNAEFEKTGKLGEYIAGIENLGSAIGVLPDYKYIKIVTEFETTGTPMGPGMYQHGGSFTVKGPPGPDRVPVGFWATAGERVTITPAGQVDNSRNMGPITINVQGGAGGIETGMAMEDSLLRVLEELI